MFEGDKIAKGVSPFNAVIARRAPDVETKQSPPADEHNSLSQCFTATDQPPGTNSSFAFNVVTLVRFTGAQPTSAAASAKVPCFFTEFVMMFESGETETTEKLLINRFAAHLTPTMF